MQSYLVDTHMAWKLTYQAYDKFEGNFLHVSCAFEVVVAQGFVSINIIFRNIAGTTNQAPSSCSIKMIEYVHLIHVQIEGYEDTLYTHSRRQFYRECDIYDTIDCIFGNVVIVLQSCNLYLHLPISGQFNVITA